MQSSNLDRIARESPRLGATTAQSGNPRDHAHSSNRLRFSRICSFVDPLDWIGQLVQVHSDRRAISHDVGGLQERVLILQYFIRQITRVEAVEKAPKQPDRELCSDVQRRRTPQLRLES